MYAASAKWLHSLIHKASMNKNVSGFFDILIGCVDNASWKRKPIKQRDLPASLTMDEYFPWKVTHCRHFFYLDRSVERWGGRHNNDHHVWQILVWRRLLWSISGRKREAPLVPVTFTKECFLFLTEWYPFFPLGVCFFFPNDFLPPLNFVKCAM